MSRRSWRLPCTSTFNRSYNPRLYDKGSCDQEGADLPLLVSHVHAPVFGGMEEPGSSRR